MTALAAERLAEHLDYGICPHKTYRQIQYRPAFLLSSLLQLCTPLRVLLHPSYIIYICQH